MYKLSGNSATSDRRRIRGTCVRRLRVEESSHTCRMTLFNTETTVNLIVLGRAIA
jgi:hypothetical protein